MTDIDYRIALILMIIKTSNTMQYLSESKINLQELIDNIHAANQKYCEALSLLHEFTYKNGKENKILPVDILWLSKMFAKAMQSCTQPLSVQHIQPIISLLQSNNIINKTEAAKKDKRFKDHEWHNNPFFRVIMDYYHMTSNFLLKSLQNAHFIEIHIKQQLYFYAQQYIDAISPTNFPFLNPEVIREAINTNCINFLHGAENFLHDMQNAVKNGKFMISTTDLTAFIVGKNIAATKGKVVFQDDLLQLIQYRPTTIKTKKIPLMMIPAWINKFYILDLQSANSFVKWIVDQEYTVFMISWVNPNKDLANKTFSDYMQSVISAIEIIRKITGEDKINCLGYCLGGTLLSCTLAYLKVRNKNYVNSATFLTTLIDFADAGNIGIFIDENQLQIIEKIMQADGYLDGYYISFAFSLLKANDMIWNYHINNYLLGKKPQAFDILYWNADSTRLPEKMHLYYLRNMYQHNLLVKPNAIQLSGVNIDLTAIDVATYIFATKDDHIAPWHSVYKATSIYQGKNKFVLGASGHITGVTNHPSKNKYSYWINDNLAFSADGWLSQAKELPGSWWNHWEIWLKERSGNNVEARYIVADIADAPGSYVLQK